MFFCKSGGKGDSHLSHASGEGLLIEPGVGRTSISGTSESNCWSEKTTPFSVYCASLPSVVCYDLAKYPFGNNEER